MVYNFEARHDRLRTRMRTVNKREVIYIRESASISETLDATVYEADPMELRNYSVTLEVRHFFFIVHTALLQGILGSGEEPRHNDEIVDAQLGLVFQVEPLGDDPPFKYTTHLRTAMRIHAIEVGEYEGSSSGS